VIDRVFVVDTARPNELSHVKQFMSEVGFDIVPTPRHHPDQDQERVGEAIPWIVTVVLGAPIAAFFTALANEAGKDAYVAIKRWVIGLSRARPPHGYGEIEIVDPEGSRINLREAAIPEKAFAALLNIDWSSVSGKTLTWTDAHGWVDRQPVVLGNRCRARHQRRNVFPIEAATRRSHQGPSGASHTAPSRMRTPRAVILHFRSRMKGFGRRATQIAPSSPDSA
jgi:hypothetical protein